MFQKRLCKTSSTTDLATYLQSILVIPMLLKYENFVKGLKFDPEAILDKITVNFP